jgi:hypothetical protein
MKKSVNVKSWVTRNAGVLRKYLESSSAFDKSTVLSEIIPFMGKLAGEFDQVFNTEQLKLSYRGREYTNTLSKRQIATLISGKITRV